MSGQRVRSRRGKFIVIILFLAAFAGFLYKQNFIQNKSQSTPNAIGRTQEETRQDFAALVNQIFIEEISDDSITLNYMVKKPDVYGVEKIEPTLGQFGMEELQSNLFISENRLASLETFEYDKLTEEQQLVYDILYEILQQNLSASDFLEYTECLGPTSGIQAQLPILLAEYNFYDREDVDTYIRLLELVPEYFNQIIAFERKKSEDGLFMNDTTAQAIIDQCTDFIGKAEDNYLIATFDKKIEDVEGVGEELEAYKEMNRKMVEQSVIPAYQSLIDALKELKGTAVNEKGLCGLEKGRDYYTYLVRAKTGSNRSIQDIDTLLTKTIKKTQEELANLVSKYPDVYYQARDVKYPYSNPKKLLAYLREAIADDYPELTEDISCRVEYIDSSLEDSMSPAFYLTSAMDNYQDNVIYLNKNKEYDLSKAFATIAHEGYPGHLYQHTYFMSTSPEPIRSVINVTGYSEGWATYAELYSYSKAGLKKEVASFLEKNNLVTLCLYAKADLAIHYQGWELKKLTSYLSDYGFDKSQCRLMYDTMIAEPASYMPYTIGYLEIAELKKKAQNALGEGFIQRNFHEFLLKTGEAPFSVIQDRLDDWIETQK